MREMRFEAKPHQRRFRCDALKSNLIICKQMKEKKKNYEIQKPEKNNIKLIDKLEKNDEKKKCVCQKWDLNPRLQKKTAT